MAGPAVSAREADSSRRWRRFAAAAWRAQGGFVWVAAGKTFGVAANAALLVILARMLDVATFGVFAAAVSAQILVGRVLLLGLDSGLVRQAAAPDLRARTDEVIAAGLRVLGIASCAALFLSLLAVPAALLWRAEWPPWMAASVVAGAAGMAVVDYASASRLARLDYPGSALLQGSVATARLIVATAVAVLARGAGSPIILAYSGTSFLYALGQLFFLPVRVPVARGLPGRLLSFSARIGISEMLIVLSLHQGSFILLVAGDRTELGLFGLALTLSIGGRALGQAFFQTILPKMARLESERDLPRFLRRSVAAASAMALAAVPVIVLAAGAAPRLIRHEYAAAATAFYWLSASVLVAWIQWPFVAACLYLLKPGLLVRVNLLRVFVTAALGFALAARFGAAGVAAAQFTGSLMGATILALAVRATIRASGKAEGAAKRCLTG